MSGSPSLDLDQSIRALIIEQLTERSPTISARRAARLCQSYGYQIEDAAAREALEALAREERVRLVRKGVYRLAEGSASQGGAEPSELTAQELKLIRSYLGKRAPAGAQLTRPDLEEAQRVASFLSPYPASPVDLEDVLALEQGLGRARAQEALWLHLKREVEVVCALYQVSRAPSRSVPHRPPSQVKPTAHEPPTTDQLGEPSAGEPSADEPSADEPSADERGRARSEERAQLMETLYSALKAAERPMSLEALSLRLTEAGVRRARGSLYELRKQLTKLNQEVEQRGERPPFTFEITGEIGLSEWGVSSSMRSSEGRLTRALEQYREQLYVELSARLRALPVTAFEQLLGRLLNELGCARVESLNAPQGDGVALMAHHPDWGDSLVLAQRSRKALSAAKVREVARSLSALQADRALLISLSGFAGEAEPTPSKVQLLGERALLELMVAHGVGVASYSVPLSFVDTGFFSRLNDGSEGRPAEAQPTGDDD